MILAKAHIAGGRKLVAVCDSELLGQRFEEKGLQIDLTGEFYRGEEADEGKLKRVLTDAYLADFVGEKSVAFGIKNGTVKKENVIKVSRVPRAQFFAV